jgi:hypothetical protein
MKRFVVVLGALAVVITSCTSEASKAGKHSKFSPGGEQTHTAKTAHVGDKISLKPIGGAKTDVTLMQVINPASIQDGMGDADKTYIATKFTITNTGKTTVVGDANNNAKVVGSDDEVYPSDLAAVNGCTNFIDGEFLIPPGGSVTGCVSFGLPPGVTPTKIKYMPSSGIAQGIGEWRYP